MRTATIGAAVLLVGCTAVLQAQFSSSGTFGSRTLGSGVQSSSGFGTSTTTGITNGGASTGAFGAGSSLGSAGSTGAQGMQAGQVQSNARYLPQNRQGAFVGADRGDTLSPFSQQAGAMNQNTAGQSAFFNQLNQQMRRNQQMQQQMQRQSQQQNGRNSKPIRVSMKVGFTPSAPVTNKVTEQMSTRLTKLPGLKGGAIVVAMDSSTAVLTGRVATEYDRELAEGLALLEPGIETVRNELIVDPAVTTAPERAPPTVVVPPSSATTAAATGR